jgi:hypothetical protein
MRLFTRARTDDPLLTHALRITVPLSPQTVNRIPANNRCTVRQSDRLTAAGPSLPKQAGRVWARKGLRSSVLEEQAPNEAHPGRQCRAREACQRPADLRMDRTSRPGASHLCASRASVANKCPFPASPKPEQDSTSGASVRITTCQNLVFLRRFLTPALC